ncbi:uncharacterized protein C8A04DRAFT_38906 [Dichotomopilus funicola]|uniref:Aminoglycoside phosphotransferase domain-containing protein n=1 Tax=Dichotomopilus funicola TaxID=1934379 RepID=A0AAN6UZ05_9PEZI|nr:hypothetical protein C8A04DRAFT_38906 [Dichotomopilus funicola]
MSSINLPPPHLNESIREIPTDQACWSDSHGGHFALFPAPEPLPDSKPLREEDSSPISRVHAVDNQAAVWRPGEAFIKAHHMDYPDVTREYVTLQFLKDRQPPCGFDFPDVLYHFETGSRYFLVVSRVPGQILEEAWRNMDETLRQHYVAKVPDVCDCLATWRGDIIGGVDGHQLLERYLVKGSNSKMVDDDALSLQQLLKNCTEMAMDVSTLVFYHCDLGPTNLLVNVSTGSLGIIDWELVGYVPVDWVRTKFRLSVGMDFNHGMGDSKRDWRRRVA